MSKLDAQRAMKAARYDSARAASGTRPAAKTTTKAAEPGTKPAARPAKSRAKAAKTATPEPASEATAPELCGHRSIQGKTCKRPLGHSESSHKYA